nr:MAG TPA: hypothetical protein [Caudoviricetes sp.]
MNSQKNNHHQIKPVLSRVQGLRLCNATCWQIHARNATRLNLQRLLTVLG